MSDGDPRGTDWSDTEIDLIVADYFEMLRMERRGEPYVKARRNAALQSLIGRSRGSIEFKHQNISAVLLKLGMDWIPGYKPMANYQAALLNGIERYLDAKKDALVASEAGLTSGVAEGATLHFEPSPPLVTAAPDPPALTRLVKKFDPAARDARNRQLGRCGEERVFVSEQSRLRKEERPDLARKVRWVAQTDGDGAGYDILSFDHAGNERLLEVKTTSGHQTTPFYLTENERALSTERPDAFRLVRVYDFNRKPRAFVLAPPLEQSIVLRPTSYRAAFSA